MGSKSTYYTPHWSLDLNFMPHSWSINARKDFLQSSTKLLIIIHPDIVLTPHVPVDGWDEQLAKRFAIVGTRRKVAGLEAPLAGLCTFRLLDCQYVLVS